MKGIEVRIQFIKAQVFEFYLYARKWSGVRPVLRRNPPYVHPNFGSATHRRLAGTWVGRVGLDLAGRGARMEVARGGRR